MMATLEDIRTKAKAFAEERDWEQFHTPKNLAMALSIEAAELMEHFQWLQGEQSDKLPADTLAAVADEIADVQVYLVMLADKLGVDILQSVSGKMEKNAAKYPVEKVRGSPLKYTEYE